MPLRFWEQHAVPSERGLVVDPQCLNPKLSVNIPDELHRRVRVAVAQQDTTIKAFTIAALEAQLRKPPKEKPPRPGDGYRGGNMLSWQPADNENAAPHPLQS